MQKTFSNFLLKCLEIIFLFKLFLMPDINVADFNAMGFCHLDIGHFISLSILSCVHMCVLDLSCYYLHIFKYFFYLRAN